MTSPGQMIQPAPSRPRWGTLAWSASPGRSAILDNAKASSRWLTVLGFVLLTAAIAVVLAALIWGAIDRVNVEAGDFAANSLQVLQAKTDIITEGHYSRFGFHHPGPAFLYTLAISEIGTR